MSGEHAFWITYREFAAHFIRDPHITVRDEQVCVPKT